MNLKIMIRHLQSFSADSHAGVTKNPLDLYICTINDLSTFSQRDSQNSREETELRVRQTLTHLL
jgi:hypothetical protein